MRRFGISQQEENLSGVAELLEQMREQRRKTQTQLRNVTEDQMLAKTELAQREVNARFMIYRLIAHQPQFPQ